MTKNTRELAKNLDDMGSLTLICKVIEGRSKDFRNCYAEYLELLHGSLIHGSKKPNYSELSVRVAEQDLRGPLSELQDYHIASLQEAVEKCYPGMAVIKREILRSYRRSRNANSVATEFGLPHSIASRWIRESLL